MNSNEDYTINVKTFGGFSIRYKDSELSFGNQSESQMVQLLQLLLHFRRQGLSRDLAKAALFGDRDVDDVSHSIRNIIYNLRKRLKALGLPDSQYVVKKKGVYFWCDDIKVIEDASEFETAFDNAMNCEDNEQKIDMLKWQLQEIEAAQLQDGEDEELEHEIKKLANGEKISRHIAEACEQLYGGASTGTGVVSGLEVVLENLKDLSRYDESLDKVTNTLQEAYAQIKESAYEVRDYGDDLDFDPRLLDKLQGRMDVIDKLRKKYGATIGDILAFADKAQEQLFEIENYDADIGALTKDIAVAKAEAEKNAGRLTELRKQASDRLAMAIEDHLHALGMPDASLEFAITDAPLNNLGADELEILFSANPGQPPRPIQKVASGGELSRIVLAIKAVTAFRDDSPASMVFDEIDTGIGGKTAQMVAERIAMIAAGKQVLCITHLPQIACMADVHLYIRKQVANGQTYTNVSALSQGERVNEIARMASGVDVSAASLDNAREMLVNAETRKKQYAGGK